MAKILITETRLVKIIRSIINEQIYDFKNLFEIFDSVLNPPFNKTTMFENESEVIFLYVDRMNRSIGTLSMDKDDDYSEFTLSKRILVPLKRKIIDEFRLYDNPSNWWATIDTIITHYLENKISKKINTVNLF